MTDFGRIRHGTANGYRAESYYGIEHCQACRDAAARYERDRRGVSETQRRGRRGPYVKRNTDAALAAYVFGRYCTTCESTHDGTETPAGLAWTCDGCGERQEYRA